MKFLASLELFTYHSELIFSPDKIFEKFEGKYNFIFVELDEFFKVSTW